MCKQAVVFRFDVDSLITGQYDWDLTEAAMRSLTSDDSKINESVMDVILMTAKTIESIKDAGGEVKDFSIDLNQYQDPFLFNEYLESTLKGGPIVYNSEDNSLSWEVITSLD